MIRISKDFSWISLIIVFFFRYFSFLKKNIFAILYSQCSWIKWDKSVSKRLGCGQFCLRYFRQVLTHSMLFQPSRKSCFSRYLSKKNATELCQNWLSNCYEKYFLACCASTVIDFVHFAKSLCACWWGWVCKIWDLDFRNCNLVKGGPLHLPCCQVGNLQCPKINAKL